MSLMNIIQFNSALTQMKQNQMDSQNLDQARQKTAMGAEALDIERQTKEAQIKIQNNQGVLSDYSTKMMMNQMKKLYGPQEDIIDAQQRAQDLTDHQIQQTGQQAQSVIKQTAQDPDVQTHIGNILNAVNPNATSMSPPMSPATGNDNPQQTSTQPPMSPNLPSIIPQVGGQQSPTGGLSLAGIDAQTRAGGVVQPSPSAGDKTGSPFTPQGQGQQESVSAPQPQQMPNINQDLQGLDNTPVTPQSLQASMYGANPNPMEAMKTGEFMKEIPGAVDIIKEENPLMLSPRAQQVANNINTYVRRYGVDQTLSQLPETLQNNIRSIASYKTDPNNLSSTMGGGAQRRTMQGLIMAVNPNWSEAQYAQRNHDIAQYFAPNAGNMTAINANRQVALHLNELGNSLKQLSASGQYRDMPVLNKPADWFRTKVQGNPTLAAMHLNLAAVQNEMTSAWAGKNNSDAKLEEWKDALDAYSAPKQWPALMGKAASLLKEAAQTREDEFETITGDQTLHDYNGQYILPPQQKSILDKFESMGQSKQTDNGAAASGNGKDYSSLWQ